LNGRIVLGGFFSGSVYKVFYIVGVLLEPDGTLHDQAPRQELKITHSAVKKKRR
jgi:hypothetical protein